MSELLCKNTRQQCCGSKVVCLSYRDIEEDLLGPQCQAAPLQNGVATKNADIYIYIYMNQVTVKSIDNLESCLAACTVSRLRVGYGKKGK